MAEPTEQDREKATNIVREWQASGVGGLFCFIAQALADERQARDEHWAKWHEERHAALMAERTRQERAGMSEHKLTETYDKIMGVHVLAIAAIRAKGEVK